MKYIANIVSKTSQDVSSFFNVVKDIEDIVQGLPTLIIGWELTKSFFPDQDILESKVTDNIYWTFSKREKRYRYEQELEKFIARILVELKTSVHYIFFNYMISPPQKRESFHLYLDRGDNYIYLNSRFIYIYNKRDEITFGVSLCDIRYIGIDEDSFISSLNRMGNNHIVKDMSFIDEKSLPFIKDNVKAVAYLSYLKFSDIYEEKREYGYILQQNA